MPDEFTLDQLLPLPPLDEAPIATLGLAKASSLYKLHFYAIAVLIILAVLGIVQGFVKMLDNHDETKKRSLIIQTVAVVLFVGLCVLACFTAFFRSGSMSLSPLSASLMGCFFIVAGLTAGYYAGGLLHHKNRLWAVMVPTAVAALMTIIMYIGQWYVMKGKLFILGTGWLFDKLRSMPVAPIDLLIVAMSAILTYLSLAWLRKKPASSTQ